MEEMLKKFWININVKDVLDVIYGFQLFFIIYQEVYFIMENKQMLVEKNENK